MPGSLPRHGGSSCAAALRSSDFFSPPVSGSLAGTQLDIPSVATGSRVATPLPAAPTPKGCDVDDTPGPPTAATANPAALPPQHGETPRLLVTAVELDRTGARAGPHGRLLNVMT